MKPVKTWSFLCIYLPICLQIFTNFVQISTNLLYIEQISIIFYKFSTISTIFTIAYQFLIKVWSRGHLPSSKRCCWTASSKSCSCWPSNGASSTHHTSTYKQTHTTNKKQYTKQYKQYKKEHKTILHTARIAWAQVSSKTDLKRWSCD